MYMRKVLEVFPGKYRLMHEGMKGEWISLEEHDIVYPYGDGEPIDGVNGKGERIHVLPPSRSFTLHESNHHRSKRAPRHGSI